MRIFSRVINLSFILGLVAMAGMAYGASKPVAATAVNPDVSAIETQVRQKAAMLPWYGVFDHLQYQLNGTEVVLSGQVISAHDRTKYDFEKEVKRIAGVTKVVNNIQVLPLSNFDDQIRRAEYRAIFSNSNLGRYSAGAIPQLHIIVKGGHVTLEGTVMNQMDRNVAGIVANGVSDVFSVTNNLQIG